MKNKIKKIIVVVVAVLFTLTIIGAIIFSVISPKNNAVTASAETTETTTYAATSTSLVETSSKFAGCFKANLPYPIATGSISNWTSSNGEFILVGGFPCKKLEFYVTGDILKGISASLSNGTNFSTTVIYDSSVSGWVDEKFSYWSFYGSYSVGLINFIRRHFSLVLTTSYYNYIHSEIYNEGYENGNVAGYEEGFQNGKNTGYEEGHNAGYEEGYDVGFEDGLPQGYDNGYTDGEADGYNKGLSRGHSDQITDPVTSFLQPVHEFMNTKFFGDLTYATIFNIILFVAVATIFIKMFSGG